MSGRSAKSREWRPKLYRGAWYAVRTQLDDEGYTVTERKALHTKDHDEAQRKFREFLKPVSQEFVSDILKSYKSEKTHLVNQKAIDQAIKFLTPHFGHLKPEHVTRDECRKYVKSRNKKNSTVRRELEVLRASLNWNNKHTPAIVELPPAPPPKDIFISKDEFQRLLDATKAHHMKLFLLLARYTAARSNAILDLKWPMVDFKAGTINLTPGEQSNKRRAIVPMSEHLKTALEEAYRGRTCDYVIEYGGEKVGRVIKGFKAAARAAKLEGVTPHVIRHSAARWMAEGGIPMSEISQYLGHTSTKVTERVYARYSPEYLKNAMSALE